LANFSGIYPFLRIIVNNPHLFGRMYQLRNSGGYGHRSSVKCGDLVTSLSAA